MSGVSVKDVDRGKDVTTWRTSATHFLSSRRHRPLLDIEQRVQRVTRVNISHSEDTQVLHYQKKGRYLAHNDFFDPKDYAGDPNTMAMIEAGARNRLATVFFYLNDVEEGGHTTFPRAGDLPIPVDQHGQADYANCEQGIQVKPEKNKGELHRPMFCFVVIAPLLSSSLTNRLILHARYSHHLLLAAS